MPDQIDQTKFGGDTVPKLPGRDSVPRLPKNHPYQQGYISSKEATGMGKEFSITYWNYNTQYFSMKLWKALFLNSVLPEGVTVQ